MLEKKNRNIILIGLVVVVGILILGIHSYVRSTPYYINQCENALDKYDENGPRLPQRLCKITKNGLYVFKANEKPTILPGDQVIIAVDLSRVLQYKLFNVHSGKAIQKPSDNIYRFCFSLLPAVVTVDNSQNTTTPSSKEVSEDINRSYQNLLNISQREVFPLNIIDKTTKTDNFICSQLLPLSTYSKIAFFFNVPAKEYLKIGEKEVNTYIAEISLIPDNVKNNDFQDISLLKLLRYYSEAAPFFQLISYINTQ